jgi:tetratricopeptide (TPR) repeat protein
VCLYIAFSLISSGAALQEEINPMSKLEVVKLFIASPSDLSEERILFPGVLKLLNDVVGHRLNHQLEPLGWEDALPNWGRPQALINEDVRQCEVFVMLLWKRWGMPSGQYSSGTEEEFEIAYERYKKTGSPHLLLYFHSVPQDMMADPGEQLQKVIKFRTRIEVERVGLFKTYDTPHQWKDQLMKHISEWLYNRVDGKAHAAIAEEEKVQVLTESKQGILQLHRELEGSKEEVTQLETTRRRAEAITHAVEAMKLIEEGKLTLAEQNFAKSIELYEEPEVLNNFGLFLYQMGSLDRAKFMFEKALFLSEGEEGKVHQAIAYCSLGEVYQMRGDLNNAQEMYEKALEINTTLGRQEGMADSYANLGDVYTIRGQLNEAEQMHKDALQIDTQIGRKKGMAKAYGRLGHVYRSRGDLNEAQEMFEKALEINTVILYREGQAQDHLNLGNVYLIRKDLDKAQEMFEKALEINTAIGRKRGAADAYGSLGNMYMGKDDLHNAEENYQKALEIDSLLGRTGGMANGYGNLGIIYEKRGSLDMAEKMHEKALELDIKIGRKEGIADDYDNLANLYISKGELERAEEFWLKAIKIYADLGNISEMVRIQSMLNSHKGTS